MEGIARLEAPAQKLPRLGLGGCRIHRQPLGRQPRRALEAPVRVGLGHFLARTRLAQVLEQPAADHLADFRFVVGNEIPRHPPHHLGDALLPLLIPVRHFHLAARQADDGGSVGSAGDGNREVLDEGVEALRQAAMAVDEVQHLVEQQQHRGIRDGEHPGEGFRSRRRGLGGAAERFHALRARQLPRQIDPRILAALGGIPRIADEDADAGSWHLRHARLAQQARDARQFGRLRPGAGDVVQRRERVRLAAAELGDEGEHRRRVRRLPSQPPQHHAGVFAERPREAGAGEELGRIAIVLRRRSRHHLLQRDGELVRAERPPLAHLLAQGDDFVPGVYGVASLGIALAILAQATDSACSCGGQLPSSAQW